MLSYDVFVANNWDKYLRCPTPDCMEIFDRNETFFHCTSCLNSYCVRCQVDYSIHEGLTCEAFQTYIKNQTQDELWFKNFTKQCPRCKTKIEKTEGCNHVLCSLCFFEFCWECMEEYNGTHFGCGLILEDPFS